MSNELNHSIAGARFWRAVIADDLRETVGWLEIPGLAIGEITLQPGRQLESPSALLGVGHLHRNVLRGARRIRIAAWQYDVDAAPAAVERQAAMAKGARPQVVTRSARVARRWTAAISLKRSTTKCTCNGQV